MIKGKREIVCWGAVGSLSFPSPAEVILKNLGEQWSDQTSS